MKYSPPGSTITVSARAGDGHIAISVADEGCGLTPPEQERMWERFERGERHVAITSGSGLGLWIANAFVAANGGTISATSDGARPRHHHDNRTAGDARRRPATGNR